MKVPDFIQPSTYQTEGSLEELALDLYEHSADVARRLRNSATRWEEKLAAQTAETDGVIAALATVRFEFQRLLDRFSRGPEPLDPERFRELLELFAKQWDVSLVRCGVEVQDLTGEIMSDDLAGRVDVQNAIPDPAVKELTVRETLAPQVRYKERVAGRAIVVTSAPVPIETEKPEAEEDRHDAGSSGAAPGGPEGKS
jgi:hypothetical protein